MADDVHPLAQAAIDAHEALAPKLADAKMAHVVSLLETFERDIAPLIAPHAQKLLDNPALPDELRPLFEKLGDPEHFGESVVLGIALGSIIGPALNAVFEPVLTALAVHQWKKELGPGFIVQLGGRPLTPDLLAAAVLKGVLTEYEAGGEAIKSGTPRDAFAHMVQTAGQSIGLAESLLLERRKQWEPGVTIDDALRYSNMNPKFYKSALNLKYAPPSVGEVITGALKGHLKDRDPAAMIAHAGMDPDNFGWLLKSAGRPYSTEQALHLWNRNEIDETRVRQVIAQSDINTEYTDDILKLREYFPPPRSIVPMLRAKAITEAQARQLLSYYGVKEPWASAFIAEAHTTASHTTTAVKELTSAQIIRMYSTRLIPRAEANTKLLALHYVQADVTLLLDFADDERHERILNATITKVGTKYVAHRLSVADATHLLNVAGVPAAAQHDLFALWNVQRDANVVVPSATSVVGAYRRGDIGPLETKQRLLALGVQLQDLDIFVADGYPPPKRADAKAAVAAVLNA